jgi:hypothetical protein
MAGPRIRNGAFTPDAAIWRAWKRDAEGHPMLDIAYLALALASFALFALAVRGCERL